MVLKSCHKNMRQRSAEANLTSKRKIKVIFVSSTFIKQLLYTLIRTDMLFYYRFRNFWVLSTTELFEKGVS